MPEYVRISKEIEFDSGHRVPRHSSKCKNPHGHRYRLRVTCRGLIIEEEGPDQGMLIDFGYLKKYMTEEVHDVLDHGFIVYREDYEMLTALGYGFSEEQPVFSQHVSIVRQDNGNHWAIICFPYVPTAENIARWCWEQLKPRLDKHFRDNLVLDEVTVWETPTSVAYYYGPHTSPSLYNQEAENGHVHDWDEREGGFRVCKTCSLVSGG